ncbi:MAG: isoprenylcysteine carboxylmethyltransferase family protein [Cyclobacteriaceae bacterium]|nr:isoprenylcysteine carboxylmethyltransferase family protein [Cyclobacteriaceae bacterium]
MTPYVLLILFWFLYFLFHSLLAANSVKQYFENKLRASFKYYRFAYSTFATIGLLGIMLYSGLIPKDYLFTSRGVVRYISLVCAAFSVIIFKQAFRGYKFSFFIGLKHGEEEFVTSGILKHVRHPLYSATILIVLGYFLFEPTLATLASALCIFLYLPLGIYLEEKKLIQQYGDRYIQYKKEVPSIIPKIKK